MCDKKNNDVSKLLSIYREQEKNTECFAYDDSNNFNDFKNDFENKACGCYQAYSNCCGSGDVTSDCCCDACCSVLCCGC